MKFTVQRHRITKTLRPNHWTIKCFHAPTPHCQLTEGPFIAVPFPLCITFSHQEKIAKDTKKQKIQFEERVQASEPDMAGMLELSEQEFKTIVTNLLRSLMDIRTDEQCKQRGGNSKKTKNKC